MPYDGSLIYGLIADRQRKRALAAQQEVAGLTAIREQGRYDMEMQERELDAKAKRAQLANYYAGVAGTSVRSDYGNTPEVNQAAEIGQLQALASPIEAGRRTQQLRDREGEENLRFQHEKELANIKIGHDSLMRSLDRKIKEQGLAIELARNETDLIRIESGIANNVTQALSDRKTIINSEMDPAAVDESISIMQKQMEEVQQRRGRLGQRVRSGPSPQAAPAAPAPVSAVPAATEDDAAFNALFK